MDPLAPMHLAALAVSLALAALLARPSARASLARRGDALAVQACHHRPAARLGGLAVFGGLLAGLCFAPQPLLLPLAIAVLPALPVLLAGLAEDVGPGLSATSRLAAALASAAVAVSLGRAWIGATGLAWLDPALAFPAFAIALTCLVTAGIAHATNLLDGLNGHAALAALAAALAMHAMARAAGAPDIAALALLAGLAALGFLTVNYPSGGVFLGDGGAYGLGHLLGWTGVLLLAGGFGVSGAAVALALFWPIADLLLSIVRRSVAGLSPARADRRHMHHLALRATERFLTGRGRRGLANPLATALLLPAMTAPPLLGLAYWSDARSAALALAACAFAYLALYAGLARLLRLRLRPGRAAARHTASTPRPRARPGGRLAPLPLAAERQRP